LNSLRNKKEHTTCTVSTQVGKNRKPGKSVGGSRSFFWFLLALFAILVGIAQPAEAQKRRKSKKRKTSSKQRDFLHIKAPSIRAKAPKIKAKKKVEAQDKIANEAENEVELPADGKRKRIVVQTFAPTRPQSIVSELSDSLNDAETNIVEVDEEIRMDCTWVKVNEYYSLWDSRRVNPYGVDRYAFKDTVTIALYDTTQGSTWAMPVKNTFVTSHFGQRGGRFHYGADLELDVGDSISAVWDGIVRITSFDARGYGYYVLVRHYNGLETLYGHMSQLGTEVGQLVKAGQFIGLGGSTGRSSGPHLHFEIRYQGNAINPENFYHFPSSHLLSDQFTLSPDNFAYAARKARKVFYHRVRSGDTMYSVASRYGLTIAQLARINGLSRSSRLRAGKRLKVKT
jgi:murein DD-endopeptidase MepM/ murein hydrolase activator NlpD